MKHFWRSARFAFDAYGGILCERFRFDFFLNPIKIYNYFRTRAESAPYTFSTDNFNVAAVVLLEAAFPSTSNAVFVGQGVTKVRAIDFYQIYKLFKIWNVFKIQMILLIIQWRSIKKDIKI